MSDLIKSCSVKVGPRDSRCRYWAKLIRAADPLPLPSAVDGAVGLGVGAAYLVFFDAVLP